LFVTFNPRRQQLADRPQDDPSDRLRQQTSSYSIFSILDDSWSSSILPAINPVSGDSPGKGSPAKDVAINPRQTAKSRLAQNVNAAHPSERSAATARERATPSKMSRSIRVGRTQTKAIS
jgi:hypothetical protein